MSRELFKQRDAFLSKAAAVPVVENSNRPPAKKPRLSTAPSKKSTAAKNQTNFALLAKIVTHMKQKHLQGDSYPLTLGEILDECSSTNPVNNLARERLGEAMRVNIKLRVIEPNAPDQPEKFCFRPPIDGIKDKKSFLRFMERHGGEGLGGVKRSDVIESLPKAEKVLKKLEEKQDIYIHHRPDKQAIIFFNDRSIDIEMDETFQKLWRSIPVESMDDEKIAEYLGKQGISFVDDPGIKKMMHGPKRRKSTKKRRFKAHNDHVDNLLDYD